MTHTHATSVLTALEQLAAHDHLCSIYETAEESFAVAVPYLRIGLDRGDRCIYIADDGAEAVVREAMRAGGIDVERALATTQLILERKEDTYLRHGSFDPEWMFTFWSGAAAAALSDGFSGLRVTGETEWVLRRAPGVERWAEYESRVTELLARCNCSALCQYNRRLCSPELILDVIRTHPVVVYRGVVCRNLYHVPPEDLLRANQSTHEVERLLTTIREREQVECTLRQQRNELRESEAMLRQMAENIREVFWMYDVVAERFTFVSPMYEEVFGRSRARMYDDPRSFLDAIHVDDRARVTAACTRARGGSTTDVQYRIARPDGRMRWIRARAFPVREPAGSITRVVGVAEDITDAHDQLEEIQIAEAALRSSEERWRSVFENSAIGMVMGDPAANILATNQAFEDLVGYSGEELRRLTVYDLTYEADKPRNVQLRAELLMGVRREMQMEKRLRCKDQRLIWVRVTASLIPGTDRTPVAVLALVEDITARRLAEQDLDASLSQSRALAGRLMHAQDDERRRIARMLHETTAQNLAALKMNLARLNRTATHLMSEAERTAVVESILLAEQSMTEIRTLSYLLHPPFLDETGLLSALRWFAAGFAERSGIKVELDLPESAARLPLDTETALFRVVQESLTNIHRHAGSETARIRWECDAETLVLEIEDAGDGIPEPTLTHITNGAGTVGVGIAGMSERMEQLGGRLEINSGDRGTTVRARLPLVKGAG